MINKEGGKHGRLGVWKSLVGKENRGEQASGSLSPSRKIPPAVSLCSPCLAHLLAFHHMHPTHYHDGLKWPSQLQGPRWTTSEGQNLKSFIKMPNEREK